MGEWLQYMFDNRLTLGLRTVEHLWLTGLSVGLAIAVGVSLGIFLTRKPRWAQSVIGLANVIQTIPSIALLGFFIPLLGIGALPAIVALFLYALLPIIRNTYTGIADVDPHVLEAGTGMGLTDWQLLTKVELPLALPTLFAGIRTAAVINVGVATLCALIAAGGLGEFIFTGISLNNSMMIMTGAVPAALLALLIDALLGLVQRHIKVLIRPLLIGLGVVLLGLLVFQLFQPKKSDLLLGTAPEFMEREDGWRGLKEAYAFDMEVVQMNNTLMYDALKNERVDVIAGYSTDGRVASYNLRVLDDDKRYFPPYEVAPLVRRETLEKYPVLDSVLNLLAGRISESTMQSLNHEVNGLNREPREVAEEFLQSIGLPHGRVEREGEADLVIGAKIFAEQYILAEMYAQLIEQHTLLRVDLKLGLGGTLIVFNALKAGEIDIYPEYTGTALQVLLAEKPENLVEILKSSEAVYSYVKSQSLKEFDGVWLQTMGFNNTYALMMREAQARELGIETISDLADLTRRQK